MTTPVKYFWLTVLLKFLLLSTWVAAAQLQQGDRLRLADDTVANVCRIRCVAASNGSLTTYNFTVADHHTYFVGKAGVWVHNACPPAVDSVLCKFRTTYKKRPGPEHTELDDFLDFHKKEKLRESNLPQPPAVSSVLDDNKFGMAAYKLSTAVLWGLVPTLALVPPEGPGRSRQQVMDDMLLITSAEALGLQALKLMLKQGGINPKTQGGWDVHHIPEKWIWKSLSYEPLFGGNIGGGYTSRMDLVPCIPLPGNVGTTGSRGKPAKRNKWWCDANIKALFGNNGFPFHGGSMDVNGVRTTGLSTKLKAESSGSVPDLPLARNIYLNVYENAPYKKTPMGEVFKVFMNKIIVDPVLKVP